MNTSPSIILSGLRTRAIKRWLGPFRRRYRELHKSQWWDADRLREYQLARLRNTLLRAYQDVPFYRRWFDDAGFDPAGVRDLAHMGRLPILTKRDVIEAGDSLHSRRFPRWAVTTAHTGGTTGTPVALRRDLWSIGNEHAFVRRQWDWAGIGMRDRCAYLTGRLVVPPDHRDGHLWRYDPVMHDLLLSTYHLRADVAQDYLAAMRRYKVVALVAYPSSAYALARACVERRMQLRLRAVLTSSETLHPEARRTIEAAFACPVFDFYGSAERVCYIFACEHTTYHVVPEYGFTELIPADHPGQARIVATGFWNEAMPLVRYDLGDQVEVGTSGCACGRAFPVIHRIVGRPSDYIVTPAGRHLGAALLTHILYGARNIRESQIVQDEPERCLIRFVPAAGFQAADLQDFQRLVRRHLPAELRVDYEQVTALPRTAAGKFQPIVSRVRPGVGVPA